MSIKVLLTGQTGSGKTSLINLLSGRNVTSSSIFSGTDDFKEYPFDDVIVVDTPGFGDIGHDNITDDKIIEKMKEYDNLNCVFCCLSSNEKFPGSFALNICEIMHLYDIQLSNFCFVFTKLDTINNENRLEYINTIKEQMCGVFGNIKILFIGKDYLDEIKQTLKIIRQMPKFSPIQGYISTSKLYQLIDIANKKISDLLLVVSDEITDKVLLKKYNEKISLLSDKVKKEQDKFFFFRNKDTIEATTDFINDLSKETKNLKKTTQKYDEMVKFNDCSRVIDKEKMIRMHRVRYILKLLKQYDESIKIYNMHYKEFTEAYTYLNK